MYGSPDDRNARIHRWVGLAEAEVARIRVIGSREGAEPMLPAKLVDRVASGFGQFDHSGVGDH